MFETVRVFARIYVLKPEEGGRAMPIFDKYRPTHNFGDENNRHVFDGQIELLDGKCIPPGTTKDVWITFLTEFGVTDYLTIGRKWRIQESPRHPVATAELLQIENTTSK